MGWGTFRTIGLIVLSGILLAFFLIWEWREKEPLMPLGIFRIRLVAAANFGGFLLAGGMYGTFLLLTLYMQTGPPPLGPPDRDRVPRHRGDGRRHGRPRRRR